MVAAAPGPQLALAFARAPSGETFLKHQYASFPFHITRPFAVDGETLLIVQSIGAGLVEGDRFVTDIVAGEGTAVRIETQGATVAHAMRGKDARQEVRLEAHPGSRLVWQPRPLVLFPGARVASTLEIVLHPGAEAAWYDAFIPHDDGGQGKRFGCLDSETVVREAGGRILAIDRFRITGDALDEAGTTGGLPVHGTFGRIGGGSGELAQSIAPRLEVPGAYAGVSSLPGEAGILVRVLARDGEALERVRRIVAPGLAPNGRCDTKRLHTADGRS